MLYVPYVWHGVWRDVLWEWVLCAACTNLVCLPSARDTERAGQHLYTSQTSRLRYGTSQHITSHNGPGITHESDKRIKPYAPRRTSQHGSTSAPPHARAACPVGEASSAHPHTRRATGVSRGAPRPRPWPWPSSCHCPASLATPVWRGRPPRV
eukprot:scaffold7016_cov66-Phaeocystis_antarctica.AAC.5